MRSKFKLFAVGFLFASMAISAAAASNVCANSAVPAGAQLERYSLKPAKLTTAEEAELGLRAVKLTATWTGHNYFAKGRDCGLWVHQTLAAGTLVLVNDKGEVVYKVDCGNRLVTDAKCPVCGAVGSGDVGKNSLGGGTSGGSGTGKTQLAGSDFWSQHPYLAKFYDFLKSAWLWALGLLALLALLALLVWLLRRLFEWLDRQNQRLFGWMDTIPPAQSAPVRPLPAQPVAATPPAVPAVAATEPAPTGPDAAQAATPAQPGPSPFVAFYHGKEGEPHKVNFAGHRHVMVTDHQDGRFTMHFKK